MAAEAVTSLKLQLVYGQHKEDFELSLPGDEAGGVLQVRHLANRVEEITGVPPDNQRLIFKGKSLTNPNALLVPDGIKNGSKIMLIGKKPNQEETEEFKRISQIETAVAKEEKKLSDITSDLDGIHRGFLHKELQLAALERLKKLLLGLSESFMKTLESLDSLELDENAKEVRAKRKSLVNRIQILLSRCDGLERGLEDLLLQCSVKK